MIQVKIKTPPILNKISDPEIYQEANLNGGNLVRSFLRTEFFKEKNKNEPNKLGADRTNFWTNVGKSVLPTIVKGFDIIIRISDFRFAQKLYGGTIKAKRVRFLTIPISKQAYGNRVSVFEQETGKKLFRIKSKKGNFLLVESVDGGIKPHYLLKQSVKQKPWPNSLPSDEVLADKFAEGVTEKLETIFSLK